MAPLGFGAFSGQYVSGLRGVTVFREGLCMATGQEERRKGLWSRKGWGLFKAACTRVLGAPGPFWVKF